LEWQARRSFAGCAAGAKKALNAKERMNSMGRAREGPETGGGEVKQLIKNGKSPKQIPLKFAITNIKVVDSLAGIDALQ